MRWLVLSFAAVVLLSSAARAEILAMLNYETKSPEQLKALDPAAPPRPREEGIAIIDVDPESDAFGTILMTIPLPPDLIAHHIFYNDALTKAYVTALGQSVLHVIDLTRFPYRTKVVSVPDCKVGEDIAFSEDGATWYLTCMGSSNVIVGDAVADRPLEEISVPETYPHGIALHEGIDRLLTTDTVRPADMGDAGEAVTVVEASTGRTLSALKVSNKPSPAGAAPVEILFVPGADPPLAYITNMLGHTLWAAEWDPAVQDFRGWELFDFGAIGSTMPLEMYFNEAGDRLYVTTASPGHFHVFDASDKRAPKLLTTLPAAQGAHHVAITPDERYAFVQNSLLNLPDLSDGSITVIDLQKQAVVGTIDSLKQRGYNPNCIVLLPEWHHAAGH